MLISKTKLLQLVFKKYIVEGNGHIGNILHNICPPKVFKALIITRAITFYRNAQAMNLQFVMKVFVKVE